MSVVVAAVMIIIAGLLMRAWAAVLRAQVPVQTRAVTVGKNAPNCGDDIPKVIWTYSPQAPVPTFIKACVANWRRHAPDHEVRVLDRDSLLQWVTTLRDDFDALSFARQSDWLRLQLLARHGGVWMDASTLLSRDLDWLHDLRSNKKAQYVGFYLDRDSKRPDRPAIETWFMASAPRSSFVTALATVLDRLMAAGAEAPLQAAVAEQLDLAAKAHRLALLRAEDGPSAWLAAVGWRPRYHYARIALTHAPLRLPALLRLRENDRAITERNWLKGRFLSGSALVELLGRPRDRR
ncbi:MAG: hypothetical protein EOP39_18475 [Rubrivivax sp.]|nr:MAG: hypothetical protein EOP39_18475 [Rubrivivax sp.]